MRYCHRRAGIVIYVVKAGIKRMRNGMDNSSVLGKSRVNGAVISRVLPDF